MKIKMLSKIIWNVILGFGSICGIVVMILTIISEITETWATGVMGTFCLKRTILNNICPNDNIL